MLSTAERELAEAESNKRHLEVNMAVLNSMLTIDVLNTLWSDVSGGGVIMTPQHTTRMEKQGLEVLYYYSGSETAIVWLLLGLERCVLC